MIAFAALSLALLSDAPRLMVLPPETDDPARAAEVERRVDAAARALGKFRVMSTQERDALIARAADAGLRCDVRTADCATRVGAFGALDFVLVTALDDARPPYARVALHDCTDGRRVREAKAPLASSDRADADADHDDDDARAAGLRLLTRAAAGESVRLEGTLRIEAPASDGAREIDVDVDGAPHGAAPLTLTVLAGAHDVVLRSASGAERVRVVVPLASVARLTPSMTPSVDGGAREALAPSAPSAAFVGGLVLAGVGAVGAAAAGAGAWGVAPRVEDRSSMSAREYNDAVGLGRTLLAVSALGGAALLLGGAVAAVGVVTSE